MLSWKSAVIKEFLLAFKYKVKYSKENINNSLLLPNIQ